MIQLTMLLIVFLSLGIYQIVSFSVNYQTFVVERVFSSHRCLTTSRFRIGNLNENSNSNIEAEVELSSPTITSSLNKIESIKKTIEEVKSSIKSESDELSKLESEYGSEITRVKKEFARIKERSYEEAAAISSAAKIAALKEVLPITDNYFRAKKVFEPLQSDGERLVLQTYDEIFSSFSKVIEDFGVTRVESLGQPFDFNLMEAVMTMPSTEYAKDIVCTEYQVGYKMGDKCVRPAMVVVSLGPGPQ
jgi:molecular chaperone GrpE